MKYYVISGQVREIIDASNAEEAAKKAIAVTCAKLGRIRLGQVVVVSEHGFDGSHDNDLIILTEHILGCGK